MFGFFKKKEPSEKVEQKPNTGGRYDRPVWIVFNGKLGTVEKYEDCSVSDSRGIIGNDKMESMAKDSVTFHGHIDAKTGEKYYTVHADKLYGSGSFGFVLFKGDFIVKVRYGDVLA